MYDHTAASHPTSPPSNARCPHLPQPGYDAEMTVSAEAPAVEVGLRIVVVFEGARGGGDGRGGRPACASSSSLRVRGEGAMGGEVGLPAASHRRPPPSLPRADDSAEGTASSAAKAAALSGGAAAGPASVMKPQPFSEVAAFCAGALAAGGGATAVATSAAHHPPVGFHEQARPLGDGGGEERVRWAMGWERMWRGRSVLIPLTRERPHLMSRARVCRLAALH